MGERPTGPVTDIQFQPGRVSRGVVKRLGSSSTGRTSGIKEPDRVTFRVDFFVHAEGQAVLANADGTGGVRITLNGGQMTHHGGTVQSLVL